MNRVATIIFLLLSVVYIFNLAPGWGALVQFNTWDGLEYIICSDIFGIDHPPGHPFYLLLGKLFISLPFGNVSWNFNLISAIFGAITVSIFYLTILTTLKQICSAKVTKLIAASIALTFAFSYVFWSHCEIPEVHTLFLALVILSLYCAFRWQGGSAGWLYLSALSLAFGIGVNILGSLSVFIPLLIFALLARRIRTASFSLLALLLIFLSGLLFYIYYPIRIAEWPIFSHPMNYLCQYKIGSLSWYIWYMSGKAWTGGKMFFLERVIPNIPLYLKFACRDLGIPFFLLSLLGIAFGLIELKRLINALVSRNLSAARTKLFLPFMLMLFVFLLLPEISIHDPSNPRATDYLMNFFLPSMLLLAFFGAYGALKACTFLRSKSQGAFLILILLLIAMPIYQFAINFQSCNLRGKNSAYILSKRTLEQIPAGSVIISKLVYPLTETYFSRIEPVIPPGKVSILDPELITREIAGEIDEKTLFARRNIFMLNETNNNIQRGHSVFVAGDVVDEDKSPEKLLLSDLIFKPWQPTLPLEELNLSFPRELFLYRVTGLRGATVVKDMPEGSRKGMTDDGSFANGISPLGFLPSGLVSGIGREVLNFDLFWTTKEKITGDVYVGMIFVDSKMRRLGEPCWHTLGGSFGVSKWEPGKIIHENINVYPPPLPEGRYSIAIGMTNDRGNDIKYLPADYTRTGKAFNYVLLAPLHKGPGP